MTVHNNVKIAIKHVKKNPALKSKITSSECESLKRPNTKQDVQNKITCAKLKNKLKRLCFFERDAKKLPMRVICN